MKMSKEENIRAVLQTHFSGFKEDIIESAVKMVIDLDVSHARWENKDGLYECSMCGKTAPYYEDNGAIVYWPCLNYCPNCGALMVNDDE